MKALRLVSDREEMGSRAIGGMVITRINPVLALGPKTTVGELYRVRRDGEGPHDDCVIFIEADHTMCWRHADCPALDAVQQYRKEHVQ